MSISWYETTTDGSSSSRSRSTDGSTRGHWEPGSCLSRGTPWAHHPRPAPRDRRAHRFLPRRGSWGPQTATCCSAVTRLWRGQCQRRLKTDLLAAGENEPQRPKRVIRTQGARRLPESCMESDLRRRGARGRIRTDDLSITSRGAPVQRVPPGVVLAAQLGGLVQRVWS
jgi:hypothetical protein